ncbi:MAG: 6-phosphofructokinase [Flavobacteriales bacterium]|nr:MAG: 6-phosphofructokinase [Flavobacteriales bacterium]
MKKIAVLTSGGDAPGMNACVRAVVRTANHFNIGVIGVRRGYQGMIENDLFPMTPSDVSNIIQRGGTVLKTARSKDFMSVEGREKAMQNLRNAGVEGLVVIGGDGSFKGALTLHKEFGLPVVGTPGTIDNDLFGTEATIGYDTAINTVVQAVDKIRDTANSHNRLFFVEVMGRDAGFIALRSGIACGAEAVLVPETETYTEALMDKLQRGWNREKSSAIIIVAEGDDSGGAEVLAKMVKERFPHFDTRVSILGHMQRGGSPSAYDRVLASELGAGAVKALLEGKTNVMIGRMHGQVVEVPFEKAVKHHRDINKNLLELVYWLSE